MRLISLAALLVPSLLGLDFRGNIKLKPLVPPLTQPWKLQSLPGPVTVLKQVFASASCAIPLLTVTPVETDSKMLVTPPSQGFHIRHVTPPSPSCADKP
jgi:hypothetical protein